MSPHQSVLLNEVLEWLDPKPGELIVDGTLGRGGHAAAILHRSSPNGRLLGWDKDPEAIAEASRFLKGFGDRVMIFHEGFENIASRLHLVHEKAQGALLDLGVSSPQLDEARRGFSFKAEGPLDMRMDPGSSLTAEAIVNGYSPKALMDIFWKYGEERFSRRVVEAIDHERRVRRIKTTQQLESIIWRSVPAAYRHRRIHPATRVFQALRIEVNHEIESLERFLSSVLDILANGGRLVIISFHSLEDRAVKNAFKRLAKDGKGRILTKKPVVAASDEVRENPRSRSAKLRVFQRI